MTPRFPAAAPVKVKARARRPLTVFSPILWLQLTGYLALLYVAGLIVYGVILNRIT